MITCHIKAQHSNGQRRKYKSLNKKQNSVKQNKNNQKKRQLECIKKMNRSNNKVQQQNQNRKQQQNLPMNPTLKQKIQTLEQKAQTLQKQGKYKQALDVYQQVLDINKNLFGTASEQYERISIKLCELCNIISMILLQKEKFDLCLMFLKKGESFCLKDAKYTAVTYNNYACYYRKTGKLRTALMYLQSALELEWKSKKEDTLADTYLNLCAVLSQLGRHNEALQNVLYSITLLQEELMGNQNINQQRVSVLAIAYHNMGVELQHLKRYEECISAYDKGYKFAQKHLGEGNGLVDNLKNVLENAIETKEKANQKQRKPRNMEKDKVMKMRSTYQQRPQTGKKSLMNRREKPEF